MPENTLFSILLKKLKEHNGKVVVEGGLQSHTLIRKIFGSNDDFEFYVVRPPNLKAYTKRITQRFVSDPNNYGRLGWIKNADKDKKGLEDFLKNGIDGKIIKALLRKVAKERFPKHDEIYQSYLPEFTPKEFIN